MARREAQAIIAAELTELRRATTPLVERLLAKQETFDRVGASGASYQVEIQAVSRFTAPRRQATMGRGFADEET